MKKMSIKELRDFMYEIYFSLTGFSKESSYYSIKDQRKIFTIICNEIN